ncbi:MAG: hypothetical protein RLZ44_936 [Pseudomonadota bacterium]|jgi:cytochrome c556
MKVAVLLFSSALALASATAVAEDDPTSRAIKYRQSVMTLVGANFKPMGAMLKGELPYDQAAFARHAADLAAVASVDILRGFPDDSEGDGSDAKGEIWLSWDDFRQKMEQFQAEAGKLGEVAAGGDRDAIQAQFGATGKTCKACHDDFKK